MTDSNTADVVIVGAGMTGLCAARELEAAGLQVDVVEARDRIGGRIFTHHDPSVEYPIELGAEFVQGREPRLLASVQAAGLLLAEMQGARWQAIDGRFELHPECGPDLEAAVAAASSRAIASEPSLREFVDQQFPGVEHERDRAMAAALVEDYDAAYAERINLRALARQWQAEDAIDGHRPFRVVGGYDGLVKSLTPERSRLHLNAVVEDVHWAKSQVMVATAHQTFSARTGIVTVPLGVLKAGALRFTPSLEAHLVPLGALEMGNVTKVMLRFRERFWDRGPLKSVGFIHAHGEPFRAWWTANPFYVPVLTAWAAGPSSDALRDLSEQQLADRAIDSAAHMFNLARGRIDELLVSWYAHDWRSDPYSLGAYSYLTRGGIAAQRELRRAVGNTLFFAGEAFESAGHNAMVHGAMAEGTRVARDVLASIARE